ncbi:hypothetical protein [Saccharopolyspora aridisoli]|nr:hypothetical protein [Saccharopolyspora aridisoli]
MAWIRAAVLDRDPHRRWIGGCGANSDAAADARRFPELEVEA